MYSYEPIPTELKPDEHKYILGAQGNVWTEYILTPEHVEYMAVPRMLALAEVLWTPKAKRNEADFIRRLENEFPELEAMKVNASKSLYNVGVQLAQGEAGWIKVTMVPPTEGTVAIAQCRTCPTSGDALGRNVVEQDWHEPFVFNFDATLQFQASNERGLIGQPITRTFRFNKATAQTITLSEQPHERYNDCLLYTSPSPRD